MRSRRLRIHQRPVAAPKTRLDEFLPAWQFHEVHSTRVRASRARIARAIREVTPREIRFFRALTWLRRFGRPGSASILNAPADLPILEVATRTSFVVLADEPQGELVIGTLVICPDRKQASFTPDEFKALRAPGFAKAALNFAIDEDGYGGCRLSTETRVYATDATTRRRFAAYWRLIYLGSSLIRRMWLRAIRRRAETG
jgi:hypothetical protein